MTHAKLVTASKELDTAFSPQMLIGCTLCFVGTVLNAYFSVNGFYEGGRKQDQANELLQNVQWLFVAMYISRIFLVCFATSRLVTEVITTIVDILEPFLHFLLYKKNMYVKT